MKKTLLAASTLALAMLARPAQAQSPESLADIYQKEAQAQLAEQRRFAGEAGRSGAYMPSPRSGWIRGGGGSVGGFDAAGRTVPGYFTTRDHTANFTSRYYGANPSRRSRVSRGARSPQPVAPFVPTAARP